VKLDSDARWRGKYRKWCVYGRNEACVRKGEGHGKIGRMIGLPCGEFPLFDQFGELSFSVSFNSSLFDFFLPYPHTLSRFHHPSANFFLARSSLPIFLFPFLTSCVISLLFHLAIICPFSLQAPFQSLYLLFFSQTLSRLAPLEAVVFLTNLNRSLTTISVLTAVDRGAAIIKPNETFCLGVVLKSWRRRRRAVRKGVWPTGATF
jgi:hypothetical protein